MATPVNATNANTYGLDLNASAEIEFKIVPIPPSETSFVRYLPPLVDDTLPVAISKLNQYGLAYEIKTLNDGEEWEINNDIENAENWKILEVFINDEKIVSNERIVSTQDVISLHCIGGGV